MATPQPKRLYQVWKGSNKFLFRGRLIFGPAVAWLLLSAVLIAGPAAAFCLQLILKIIADDGRFLQYPVLAVAVIVTTLDLIFLFLTSSRDPGIVPRNTQPIESEDVLEMATPSMEWIHGRTPHLSLPRTKEVITNGTVVKVKYCDTCLLYRPPRASHCSVCDNCVQRFDHHCPWVGQCIGLRNYRWFFLFISSSTFLCIYVFIFSLLDILKRTDNGKSFKDSRGKEALSAILILYCFVAVWFVGGLTLFHLYLISTNQTTYENFRNRYDKKGNPHNRGMFKNFKELLFSTIPPSLNDFRSWVLEDEIGIESVTSSMVDVNSSKDKIDIEMGTGNPANGASISIPEIPQNLNDNGIDDNLKSRDWNEDRTFLPSSFPTAQGGGDSNHGCATTTVNHELRDYDLVCSPTIVSHELEDCNQGHSTTPVNNDLRGNDQGCTEANEAKVAGEAGERNFSKGITPANDVNLTFDA